MGNHPNDNDTAPSDAEAAATEIIYNRILSNIIVEVTCGIHRAAKTGVLPYPNVMAEPASVVDTDIRPVDSLDAATIMNEVVVNTKEINGEVVDKGSTISEVADGDGDAVAAAGNHAPADNDNIMDASRNNLEAMAKSNVGSSQSEGSAIYDADRQGPEEKGQLATNNGQDHEGNKSGAGIGNEKRAESNNQVPPLNNEPKSTIIESSSKSSNIGFSNEATTKESSAASSSKSSPKLQLDHYGRVPGKEAKYLIQCPNTKCDRYLSSSKLALHLEECMGIQPIISKKRNSTSATGSSKRGSATGAAAGSSSTSKGVASGKGGGKVSRQGKQAKKAKRRSSKNV